jgi:NADPH:quinone reductase-like Zn-dependent oxidoreductase
MMDRRRFVAAFAGALVIARSLAEAQSAAKVDRIGFLLGATGESVASLFGALGPALSRLYNRHVRVVGLKPNKDLAYMNELFEAGKLAPVIDGPYKLADVREAFRLFGTGEHKGKIMVTMA